MSIAQIKDLYAHGHEIGAHTRTHPDLATLTSAQQQTEIQGSRQDLIGWNVGPINSFSYPYGSYTATTIQIVKNAGYSSATATINGDATPSSDKFQLERESITNTTTLSDVEARVDAARTNHTWLILELHGIDTSGTTYSMTPTLFNQVVDYIKQKGIPVVTISQGAQSI
jgi:peptidoglycan/xylan/chitin deacetylase (PgdA/CDA1 family)